MAFPSRSSVSERALTRVGTSVGEYRITRLIGIGGMAAVYAAVGRDGRAFAIKSLLEHFREEPDVCRLFSREAFVANRVEHPGAVPVLEHDVDEDGCPFLVMPLLEGETLRARWERANKRLPVSEVGVLMADVLDVLASAHARGIVHRDIKPENLFLTSAGEVRVLDFGIARRLDGDASVTATGGMLGTPLFMPPEQALGQRAAIGPASDCWAVGATIFTMLSGEFVHLAEGASAHFAAAATRPARSLSEAAPHLPAAIVQFVDKALVFEPEGRWRSAEDMRIALLALFEDALGEPIPSVALRVRAELAAEFARVLEDTKVRSTRGAELRNVAPRRVMAVDPDVEVNVLLAKILGDSGMLTPAVHHILVKYGLGRFDEQGWFVPDPRSWWPMDLYMQVLHEINVALGTAKTIRMTTFIAKYVPLPPNLTDIHALFEAIDVVYHAGHRKAGKPMFDFQTGVMTEGIGHFRYHGNPGTNLVIVETNDPFPCDVNQGVLLGFARRFERHAFIEHAPGPCRERGAESCVYHVSW